MGTLELTDGTTTVDFLNPNGLHIKWDAYRQRVAQRDPDTGLPLRVEQLLPCAWLTTDDDVRADTLHDLRILGTKAWEWVNRFRLGKRNAPPVWLPSSTHNETNTRYPLVYEVRVEQLSGRHWGPESPVDLVVKIVHDGAQWGAAPNATLTAAISAETLYNKDDADGDNYFTLSPSDVPGDVEGLLKLEVDPDALLNTVNTRYLLALRTHTDSAELDKFSPLFQAADELDNVGLQGTEAWAPADTILTITSDVTLRWELDSTNRPLSLHAGTYLVYAIVHGTGAGSATIQFSHGNGYITSEAIDVDSGSELVGVVHYLGRHTIPGGNYNPDLTDPAAYDILLDVDITGSYTVKFYSVWTIPVWEGIFDLEDVAVLSVGEVVIDGIKELVYEQSSAGVYQQASSTAFSPRGPFLKAKPGLYNRFYFFVIDSNDLATFNGSADFNVYVMPRFASLRGAA